jgi:1-phosphatidylinositol-3-phosphate 5-kinase
LTQEKGSGVRSELQSPFSTQDHYTLPTGVSVPIVVYEGEPSSIVAYSLNSYDYKKSFEEITSKKNAAEQTPSPVVKRKSQSQDKSETNDDKASGLLGFLRNKDSKNDLSSPISSSGSDSGQPGDAAADKTEDAKKSKNLHIEVQFQDAHCNFFCRIYFAEKFASLRAQVLPIGEEGYIRSLSRSVQWNARGGKSGSNFAKTADDRFVLKDMSKSEVQLFLESAPNYFAYMHKCYSTGQPTLLGKIVGIYQVIFKNNSNASLRTNLLVMENLFYNRTVSQKFDLKGSMRNRMVNPDNQEGEIVLLDENLLKSGFVALVFCDDLGRNSSDVRCPTVHSATFQGRADGCDPERHRVFVRAVRHGLLAAGGVGLGEQRTCLGDYR